MKTPAKKAFFEVISFPVSDTKNGALHMFQYLVGQNSSLAKALPFQPRRILVMKGMSGKDKRGAHTHHKTRQILICIQGSCLVSLDNGTEKADVRLDKANEGLLLEPYVWHVMSEFAPDTILLDIADTEYDEKDYIRDYEQFLRLVRK